MIPDWYLGLRLQAPVFTRGNWKGLWKRLTCLIWSRCRGISGTLYKIMAWEYLENQMVFCRRRLLFGYSGATNRASNYVNWEAYSTTKPFRTPNGQVLLYKQPIIENNEKVVGFQDGVVTIGNSTHLNLLTRTLSGKAISAGCVLKAAGYGCCLVKMA
jgi:hypothetical protein